MFSSKEKFKSAFIMKIETQFGKSLEESSLSDKYAALASLVREAMTPKLVATNNSYLFNKERQVYYFSLEFLFGKFLDQNLIYLNARDMCFSGLRDLGIDLDELIDCEPDAGLGNGGLGRLASCFLDSMASMGLPGHGCGIRYKYGLFSQKIIDGYQVELPDNWLREQNAWEIRKPDKAVVVKFGGDVSCVFDGPEPRFVHENYLPVLAVPYDMPVLGYRNQTVNTLRLWSAEAVNRDFDFASFSRGDYMSAVASKYQVEAISEVLYPDDSNYQNRQLRLKQQYFFVSAGLQSIIRRFKKGGNDIRDFSKLICIHINDTHPALAVPELMRILVDDEALGWEEAWEIVSSSIAYTNHTIMPEALEKWPVELMQEQLPRVYMIIDEIHRRFETDLYAKYPENPEKVKGMSIIGDGTVRMANLAVVGSFSVNGVAAVHTEILKNEVMRDLYETFPEKFNNKTNGITHRRWLLKSNPGLSDAISESITKKWIKEPVALKKLNDLKDDRAAQEKFFSIKRACKERLSDYVWKHNGIKLDPDSIFDSQVKRIHAYKRQLLNALHILHLYNELKEDPKKEIHPHTFIFAGKAAPSYYYAKTVIKFINVVASLVDSDPRISEMLKVVFLENYNISVAELVFPASDISEQISTASKEASGTGNMKFMMNGAVTLGTMDGANIEICEKVGQENFITFGLSVGEVLGYYSNGGYNSYYLYENDPRINRVLNQISGKLSSNVPSDEFSSITRSLLEYNDEYFVLRDFDSYCKAHRLVDELYRDRARWGSMSIVNMAMSGGFSSDNTIAKYAQEIWKIKPVSPQTDRG